MGSLNKAFIDSSGFFALLVKNDPYHSAAKSFLEKVKVDKIELHTSDYVLDETCTLLKARKVPNQISMLYSLVDQSRVLKIHWIDSGIFRETEQFYLQHDDQNYSFTDSLSFILMKRNSILYALTTDKHFLQAGFQVI